MKINRLEITNCLGIKSFAFNPGRINLIKGANESGKTSILEIIERGIRNNSRRVEFVKKGEEQAEIFIELDNGMSIDRKINADGKDPQPKVIKDGFRATAAEGMLKALTGGDQFNPVDFLLKKDKEQAEILLGQIPLKITVQDLLNWFGEVPPVDISKHALMVLKEVEKYYYSKRKEQNLLVKQSLADIKALFKQLPDNYMPEGWREVKLSDIFSKIEKANISNEQLDKASLKVQEKDRNRQAILDKWALKLNEINMFSDQKIEDIHTRADFKRETLTSDIAEIDKKIQELLEQKKSIEVNISLIAQKEEALIESENENRITTFGAASQQETEDLIIFDEAIKEHEAFLEEVQPVDVAPLKEEATKAEEMRGFLPIYDNIQTKNKEHSSLEAKATQLDLCVEISRAKPAELLATVEMPIPGLGINDDGNVTIDELPIKNLSTSAQLRLALNIAKNTAGDLKIINIDRFESLDPIVQEQFFAEIADDDFQYFITVVDTGELRVEQK